MERDKKNRLNQLQTINLAEKIKSVCQLNNGVAVYAEGWDDNRVLAEMGSDYTIKNVTTLRVLLIGELAKKKRPATLADLEERIAALEEWAARRPVERFRRKDDPTQ